MAEEHGERSSEAVQTQSKSRRRFVIAGLGVLLLVGSAGFLWQSNLARKFMGGEQEQGNSAAASQIASAGIGPIYPLGTFIVNLNDPMGRRYLKLKAELELRRAQVEEELDRRMPQIRDSIILLLSNRSFEEIASIQGKMRLRRELLSRLNRDLGDGKLKTIYFTEFVVQ
jgi:flagellar FliL protein